MCFTESLLTRAIKARFQHVELGPEHMHGYQDIGVNFILDNPFCGLFQDMGLGKTVAAGTAAAKLLDDFEIKQVLVIAPLRVANSTWPNEFKKWRQLAGYRYELLTCEGVERRHRALRPAPFHFINRENVPWLADLFRYDWPYDMVIIDESSSFKDHKTKRFKKLANIRQVTDKEGDPKLIKRLVELTASPAAESYMYLFGQIYLLDNGDRFGKHITKFQSRFFEFNRYRHTHTIREGAKEQIEEKISDICLVMKAEDYLDMPDKVMLQHRYALSDESMAIYRKLEKDFIVQVGEYEIEAEQAASLSAKLRQLCSGFIYHAYQDYDAAKDEFKTQREVVWVHDEREQELLRIVEESQDENLLIAYHFKESLARIKKVLPKAVEMDKKGVCVDRWNAGKIKHLIAHPQSAGHGLNLQKGGRRIVFFDMPESLEQYEQFIGRVYRQGQSQRVFIHHLLGIDTKDEIVYRALQEKNNVQGAFFKRLKKLQAAYMRRLKAAANIADEEL